jgi:hypothetical protein
VCAARRARVVCAHKCKLLIVCGGWSGEARALLMRRLAARRQLRCVLRRTPHLGHVQ